MSKLNKLIIAVLILIVVVLLGFLAFQQIFKKSSFYAVYLRTGDLYFGELSRFPVFGLKNPYLLQLNQANEQNPLSIQKFSNIFWGPEDFIKINSDEVVWIAKLNPAGQLAQVLKNNPNLLPTTPVLPSSQTPQP